MPAENLHIHYKNIDKISVCHILCTVHCMHTHTDTHRHTHTSLPSHTSTSESICIGTGGGDHGSGLAAVSSDNSSISLYKRNYVDFFVQLAVLNCSTFTVLILTKGMQTNTYKPSGINTATQ